MLESFILHQLSAQAEWLDEEVRFDRVAAANDKNSRDLKQVPAIQSPYLSSGAPHTRQVDQGFITCTPVLAKSASLRVTT